MAKIEDDLPNFDNLNLSDFEPVSEEPAAKPLGAEGVKAPAESEPVAATPAEEPKNAEEPQKAEPISDVVERLDDKQKGIEEGKEKEKEEKTRRDEKEIVEKGPSKLPVYLPAAVAVILPVAAAALAVVHVLSLSTAVYLIAFGYVFLCFGWVIRRTPCTS